MANEKSEDPEAGGAVPPVGDRDPLAGPPAPPAPAADAARDADPAAAATDELAAVADRDEARRVWAAEPARPAAEPAEPARAEHLEEDAHEEERGWSVAGRLLTFLVLLLAGAALGIWAAPRVAPHLPAGMAPVAAWLTPGRAELETRVAALEGEIAAVGSRLEARLDALPDAEALAGRAQAAVETARGELFGEIDALRGQIEAAAGGDTAARLGQVETAVEGAAAELAALKTQVESGAPGLSADAAAGLDTYRAELDGVRAEVGQLSGAVSALGARLDQAQADLAARASEAEAEAEQVQAAAAADRDLAAARADVAAIRAALASGEPFQEPLERLAQSAGVEPPAGLSAAAASGVATPAALRASFSDAAHEAIRSSIVAGAGDGVLARSRAFLEAQVASRSLTPREGATPDAVLSRVEDALRRDDLEAALAEAEALPSEAKAALSGWIEAARRRADAAAALETLNSSVSNLN
jgi:hypothetical protein